MSNESNDAVENWRTNLGYYLTVKVPYGQKGKIAEAAGIHKVFLSHLLRGTRSPSLETAASISAAIGIPIDVLILEPAEFESRFPRDEPALDKKPTKSV